MSDDEEGTITPETRINQLEGRLAEETDRLEKLYVAYKKAEEDLEERKAIIEVLEKEAIDKEIDKEGLESLLSDKEAKIHDIEVEGAKTAKRVEHLEPELEKMEEMHTRESARLGRVFELAEELDESNRVANAELGARDDWYVQHMQVFEDLSKAMQTRFDMIDRAVAAAKEMDAQTETFREMRESVIGAIKEKEEQTSEGEAAEEESAEEDED